MEEIIDMLREAHKPTAFALDLPDHDILVEIQEEILISLPHDLRTYLLEVSDVVCGRLEPVTASDPRSHTYLPDVTSRAWDLGMPREFIVICEYDGGFAHISEDGAIGYWHADDGETDKQWESFWHWAQEEWLP